MFSRPYFVKKCPFAQKHSVLASFFKNFMKNPCCNAHIWSTNVNSVKITLLFGRKKSIGCPFFQLSRKNDCSYAHIMSKKLNSPKKHCFHAHTLVKKRLFSQKHGDPMSFFSKKLISCQIIITIKIDRDLQFVFLWISLKRRFTYAFFNN